jgi:biotin transport system substrate-specific component
MFAAMLLGSGVIFALGLAQRGDFVPQGALLASGLIPFIPGDILKSALAAGLFPALWKLAARLEGRS